MQGFYSIVFFLGVFFFPLPSFLPFLCSRFVNFRGSDYLGTWNWLCVYSLRPLHFRGNWVAFAKYSSSFDFEQKKKKSQRRREVVIDGRSICHS